MTVDRPNRIAWTPLLLACWIALVACGGGEEPSAPAAQQSAAGAGMGEAPDAGAAGAEGTEATPSETEEAAAGAEIDPESLVENGGIVIKQYQAAFIGSGTLGKGTLSYGGKQIPFRIECIADRKIQLLDIHFAADGGAQNFRRFRCFIHRVCKKRCRHGFGCGPMLIDGNGPPEIPGVVIQ